MAKRKLPIGGPVEVGTLVFKRSGKPFKSGNRINTVRAIVDHPVLEGELAYVFVEDDSLVAWYTCLRVMVPSQV